MKKAVAIIRRYFIGAAERRLPLYASSGAFYVFLSIIPCVMLVAAVLPMSRLDREQISEFIAMVAPKTVISFLETIADQVYQRSVGVWSVSAVVTLWSASRVVSSFMRGIITASGSEKSTAFVRLTLKAMGYSILIVLAMYLLVLGSVVLNVLGQIRADGAVYKAIDFTGSYVESLNVAGRMTICNMAVEMGAKTAYMQPNQDVLDYVAGKAVRPYEVQYTDPDYQYAESHVFDVTAMEPALACPSSVENVHPLREVIEENEIRLDQGYIGSCTGGRTEDIAIAAKILKGRHIPPYTRLIIVPASCKVMQECMEKGYLQDLMEAGATITTPGCGACLGAHEGCLAPGEVCITSTNRNFPGRMGSREALMYLASPAAVAASIRNGHIVDPRPYLD